MQRNLVTLGSVVAIVALTGCVSSSGAGAASETPQERTLGTYLYETDEFTDTTTLTYRMLVASNALRSHVGVIYSTQDSEYWLFLQISEVNWFFFDTILYAIGDQTGQLLVDSFDRDVTPGGIVRERLFVQLTEEQLAVFQTEQPIAFSLRGSEGRLDTEVSDRFQTMLQRIVAASEYIDQGQPVPQELFEGYFLQN